MKKVLLALFLLMNGAFAFAQLNMRLLSHVQYNANANDIWAWVDLTDSTEYAIVGLVTGVSIVSLKDPENAIEVAFIPGPRSTWRDIKTWGNFAYVTNETSNGVLVIDMSHLPDSVVHYDWTPNIPDFNGEIRSCHNLYIDEFGICFLSGCNLNSGGVIYVDVATTPGVPTVIGWGPPFYSHDSYARDRKLYSSEIYEGRFAVYDVSDPVQPVMLASQRTPYAFTHNTWLSDDGNVIFTTDERANGPVGAYDISDLNNIQYLDEFRPVATLGRSVIPHNVHVWRDWLIISYYTDGGIVVDASRPNNLIEVGNFDTFLGIDGGFDGAWGAYPFLPSGNVLVTDISNGLYVCGPNYVRACWLEGTVTDGSTGLPLAGVAISIQSPQPNLGATDAAGNYSTGQAIPGTFDIVFSKFGYQSKTVSAVLENGVVTLLDVTLFPAKTIEISGIVRSKKDDSPIENAEVLISNEEVSYRVASDENGRFSVSNIISDRFTVTAGKWGYYYATLFHDFSADTNLIILLEEGYQDDFLFDYGWSTSSMNGASSGFWERGEPNGTTNGGSVINPNEDVDFDLGVECYVTGNRGGNASNDDVDNGRVILTSPPMKMSDYNEPVIQYSLWFVNAGGQQGVTPNDTLNVILSNGTDNVVVEQVRQSLSNWRPQSTINVREFLTPTDEIQISFVTGDLPSSGHLVEAAVDAFIVIENKPTSVDENARNYSISANPNPFSQEFSLKISGAEGTPLYFQVCNSLGQKVESGIISPNSGHLSLGRNWQNGMYFITILDDQGRIIETARVIRER